MFEIVTDRIPGSPALAVDRVGTGELVVFLHGVGGNRRNWSGQLLHVAPRFRAVAWDARGYGDSEDYDGPLSFADFTADLLRLVEYYGAERAHLVGLSMGGNIATHFALCHPDRVASLMLCDSDRGMVHISQREQDQFVRQRCDPLIAGQTFAEMAPAVVRSLLGPHAPDVARNALLDSMLRLRKESYIKAVQATVAFDVTGTIRHVTCPTLVVVGEYDRLTPVTESQAMCAEIKGARLAVIPEAGHISNLEQPEFFNRAILEFLLSLAD